MGCSYDPVQMTIYPSPAELWMEENHFSEISRDGLTTISCCNECGQILSGSRYGYRFLQLHVNHCPIAPRGEVPQKTEEQCKEYPRIVYR